MTTPEPQPANPSATPGPLPTVAHLLAQTDWASLEHAFPDNIKLADALTKILADDIAIRSRALADLQEAVHHQNTIYPATTRVALYLAALLSDPRAGALDVEKPRSQPRSLRAVLLDWLGEMADDVGDESLAAARRFGFGIYAEQAEFRAARPTLFRAVAAFTSAPEPEVRHAAVTTALLLLDTHGERRGHRTGYEPLVEEILATSVNRYHRARALDSLDAWDWDTAILRRAESIAEGKDTSAWRWSEELPF